MKEDQDFMDDIAKELQYDMLIADMQDSLLPKFTYGQLDALRHACEVELLERCPSGLPKDLNYNQEGH